MAQLQKKQLMQLIEVEPIGFVGKETGQEVTKIRHTFLVPDKTAKDGFVVEHYYLDKDNTQMEKWQSAKAEFDIHECYEFPLVGRIWDGKVKWRLSGEEPNS